MDWRSQRHYWDRVAGEKPFHHPLRLAWLDSHLVGSEILDCGCGYGRLLAELPEDIGPLDEIAQIVERRRQLAPA